ncbi:MAG TPA: hypothetical protein VGM75_21715 [Pseudonocardiaceae bacterium]
MSTELDDLVGLVRDVHDELTELGLRADRTPSIPAKVWNYWPNWASTDCTYPSPTADSSSPKASVPGRR